MSLHDVEASFGLPPADVGPAVLALPEDQWFDRKSVRISPQKLAQALVAFSNAEGGIVVVGVSDGTVEGTDAVPEHRNELMQAHVQHADPPVRARSRLVPCVTSDDEPDHLLVLDVTSGDEVHSTTRDDVYLRVGDESRRLTFVQRQELLYDKRQSGFEVQATEVPVSEVDEGLAREHAARIGHPSWRRLFEARGLAVGGQLTVAGLVLFGDNPQGVLPNAQLRVSRFDGTVRETGSRQALRSDVRFEGPLLRALPAAAERVREVQPRRRALARGGRFEDLPLIPTDAWLEGLVNAAVHRSYSLQGDLVHVDVFDDRIEVSSPGRFPGLVDLHDPARATRFARNPRIARVCADAGFGQEFGEGLRRMADEMRLANLAPPSYRQGESVRLVLSGAPVPLTLADADALPEGSALVVAALREASSLSTRDLAEVWGVARPTAVRRLAALRKAGVVEWVGKSPKDPHARWRLPGHARSI